MTPFLLLTTTMKEKGGGVPSEVLYTDYENVARIASARRRKSLFLRTLVLSLTVLYGLHLWSRGYLPGFSGPNTCASKPHRHRKPLYGKEAEKLFLYDDTMLHWTLLTRIAFQL